MRPLSKRRKRLCHKCRAASAPAMAGATSGQMVAVTDLVLPTVMDTTLAATVTPLAAAAAAA
uniref:Uncharacterized protein n=1 Tax=Anopheles minimus TaxID=112268 RepID=A0A182WNC0_9DIPT